MSYIFLTSINTCYILVLGLFKNGVFQMGRKFQLKFYATVSDRGQIFIPKKLQEYFNIAKREQVMFVVEDDGRIVFSKKKGECHAGENSQSQGNAQ